jgi:predicted ATPase/DNA-binding CsgD family transcriptional regulator
MAEIPSSSDSLPIPRTRLIGRESERAAARALLLEEAVPLLTLTGPGGVGKTRLALAIAQQVADRFADGAVFVDLAPLRDATLVLFTIAVVLDVHEMDDRSLLDVLTGALRYRHVLLVLDNCEHLLAAAPDIAALLTCCPRLHVLATSRAPLRIQDEQEFAVPPLALPDAQLAVSAAAVSRCAAVELFVRQARAADAGFLLTDDNAASVGAVCRQLDGLPLAIELAAARVKVLSVDEILAQLDRQLPFLTGGARDLPGRLRTMRDAIAWSYDLLDPREQEVFRHLSVFAGGWTLEAAEAIERGGAGARSVDRDWRLLDVIASLVDKSLVQRIERPGQTSRYTMLEPVRQFALGRLDDCGEEAAVCDRHADYFLALVGDTDVRFSGPGATAWLARLEEEHDNLRAVLRWLCDGGRVERGLSLIGELHLFWLHHGHTREGLVHVEAFLALPQASSRSLGRAKALRAAASLRSWHGDAQCAMRLSQEATDIFGELGDGRELAKALNVLGICHAEQGDDRSARAAWERSLALFRGARDNVMVARVLANLGLVLHRDGEIDRSLAMLQEGLALARTHGHLVVVAKALADLGCVAERSGRDEWAAELYRERVALYRDLGIPWGIAESLEELVGVALRKGQAERATRLLAAASALREQIGLPCPDSAKDSLRAARIGLPGPIFEAAWRHGRSMPVADAVALALETDSSTGTDTSPQSAMGLTPREVEVLQLVAAGRSNAEIAQALSIAQRTVTTHASHILNKVGLESRGELIAFAHREGLA